MCVSFKKYTIKDTHTQSNYTPNVNVKVKLSQLNQLPLIIIIMRKILSLLDLI